MNNNSENKPTNQPNLRHYLLIGILSLVVVLVAMAITQHLKQSKKIYSFDECQNAGGLILEISPIRCQIDGQTYISQQTETIPSTDTFIGLTEKEALQQAASKNVTARVVERDGAPLPITMDYQQGRFNLYIKEGKVYKIKIEGVDSL